MLEFIAVIQWFNPFFWMFRRALRENHEFLADQAVLAHGTAPSWYKQILINQYVGDQLIIANNFNYSLIKTRIKMMSKIKSRKITHVKILIGFVMAASLIAVFACEQKESMKAEKDSNVSSVTLVADGHTLQISGDVAGIEKLKSIIAESGNYDLKSDLKSGQFEVTSKNNNVDEVVVTTLGSEKSANTQDDVFLIVEQMPEFPDGQLALRKFIAQSIKYPVQAQEKGIQGKVFVNFVVEKDGSVGAMKIARGVDPSIDREALRVVGSLPKWKPGMQKGEAVRVSYTIPINFVLQ
jgi:TonB family protein